MLIVNPFATSTTEAGRDALVNTLSSRFELEVEHTTHRGHAHELARRAHADGLDAIIIHGGDGTVNEVVNGLLPDPQHLSATPPKLPAIAVIPGGSANVFARALGIAPDPLDATAQIMHLLNSGERRRVSLGHTENRWFLFNVGMGVDAQVVKAVEAQRRNGKKATPALYVKTSTKTFLKHTGRKPTITVSAPGMKPLSQVYFAFVSNTTPWTYLQSRPVHTNPKTTFNTQLGIFASTSMSTLRNLPVVYKMIGKTTEVTYKHITRMDDVPSVTLTSSAPIDVQMDGDYLGMRTQLDFTCHQNVLEVVAPISLVAE